MNSAQKLTVLVGSGQENAFRCAETKKGIEDGEDVSKAVGEEKGRGKMVALQNRSVDAVAGALACVQE